jgi:hypothetical protein
MLHPAVTFTERNSASASRGGGGGTRIIRTGRAVRGLLIAACSCEGPVARGTFRRRIEIYLQLDGRGVEKERREVAFIVGGLLRGLLLVGIFLLFRPLDRGIDAGNKSSYYINYCLSRRNLGVRWVFR